MERLPGGLQKALTAGRWLPIIGAGISATAVTDDQRRPPGWKQLGKQLGEDLLGPDDAGPIDALSAYADTFGRPRLVERLSELLLVRDLAPGAVHQSFAKLPFDRVVTTNIDFLLERAYEDQRRPYEPLLGESQLALQPSRQATRLLKFHGDLRHPDQLVVTEDDYDGFLRRSPLLATALSWWLLTREPVFFGYSLDDADLREILALLRERLGRMTRPAWAILPADPHDEAARFQRRGIKAIVLDPDPTADRAVVLAEFFTELRTLWEQEIAKKLQIRTDAASAELRRPAVAPQLALFVASRPLLALYREFVFQAVPRRTGLLPLGIDDIRTQDPGMDLMAIDMALSKAAVVVYDSGSGNSLSQSYVASRRPVDPAVVNVLPDLPQPHHPAAGLGPTVSRPMEMGTWGEAFVPALLQRINAARPSVSPPVLPADLDNPKGATRHQDLLLTCLALLEGELRRSLTDDEAPGGGPRGNVPTVIPLNADGGRMKRLRDFFGVDFEAVIHAVRIRHDLVQNLRVDEKEIELAAIALRAVVQKRSHLLT
ncbi:SIR2 family protein [Kitasatospora sp. RG8]|uniref:SIR2 family NAD-dependent protein deacylase n=1 Tax=Kitasatospora sp. RG8 TaxID=2820815 RepID=UPI0027DBB06C|nr:SIR2 family protein [Kitasatospora sp. RG8]